MNDKKIFQLQQYRYREAYRYKHYRSYPKYYPVQMQQDKTQIIFLFEKRLLIYRQYKIGQTIRHLEDVDKNLVNIL